MIICVSTLILLHIRIVSNRLIQNSICKIQPIDVCINSVKRCQFIYTQLHTLLYRLRLVECSHFYIFLHFMHVMQIVCKCMAFNHIMPSTFSRKIMRSKFLTFKNNKIWWHRGDKRKKIGPWKQESKKKNERTM